MKLHFVLVMDNPGFPHFPGGFRGVWGTWGVLITTERLNDNSSLEIIWELKWELNRQFQIRVQIEKIKLLTRSNRVTNLKDSDNRG